MKSLKTLKSMNKIVYVSDFFLKEIVGGGELNDNEVLKNLSKRNVEITLFKSAELTVPILKNLGDNFFIVSNFCLLSKDCVDFLTQHCRYMIYEHDHKYLINRNPAAYPDYTAPQEKIINKDFYANAVSVFCQSSLHKEIVEKNLHIKNIYNVSGNFWSDEVLSMLERLSLTDKRDCVSIMNSNNWHKNTLETVKYCKLKKIPYDLIPSAPYDEFLFNLSKNKKLMFFPKTPETLSRICVEARMMNMSVIANKNVGATYEDWFSLKQGRLIEFMKNKKKDVTDHIVRIINE